MRLILAAVIGLLVNSTYAQTPVEAQAKRPLPLPVPAPPAGPTSINVSVQEFQWGADGRYNVKLSQNGQALQFRGDLRDNSKSEPQRKDQTTILLRHFQQGFLILAVTIESEPNAYVFLIEGFATPFNVMNSRAIRARRDNVLADMEGILAAFKKVSGFDTAQSMNKMAEYFNQNPNKKAHELYDSIEKEEAFVRVLAKPKNAGAANDQGVQQPQMPSQVTQSPAPTRQPGDPMDITMRPDSAPPGPDDDFQDPQQQEWLRQERARLKAERERRAREIQMQRQQQGITGYDVYGRPIYQRNYGNGNGGYYPSQQQPQYPQPRQYDPYRQQSPGFFRPNPSF